MMRSLVVKTGITVVTLVCLCSLFLATTARSSRIPNNPIVVSAKHSGVNMGESGVTCMAEDGGCNGAANYTLYPLTGCQSGFQNYGGTCKRRDSFIRGCLQHEGTYDPETCTCTFDTAMGSR